MAEWKGSKTHENLKAALAGDPGTDKPIGSSEVAGGLQWHLVGDPGSARAL